MDAMDAMDALDAVGERNVQLVRQVGADQSDGATPCTEWDVRTLAGHLITGRHVYRGFLEGVPVAGLRQMLQQQGQAAGDDPVAACETGSGKQPIRVGGQIAISTPAQRSASDRIGAPIPFTLT